jgi:hypothetical protein
MYKATVNFMVIKIDKHVKKVSVKWCFSAFLKMISINGKADGYLSPAPKCPPG